MKAGVDRNAHSAALDGEQRILDALFERNVAGDHGDRFDSDIGMEQSHHEGDSIV